MRFIAAFAESSDDAEIFTVPSSAISISENWCQTE